MVLNNCETIQSHCIALVEYVFENGLCECDLSGISVGTVIKVLEKMGYEVRSEYEHPSLYTNGWEIDFWGNIYKKGEDKSLFTIMGSVIYGDLQIKKCD